MTATLENIDTIANRKQRWKEFMTPGAEAGFMFRVNLNLPENREVGESRPPLWPANKQQRIDWIMRNYDLMRQQAEWLHDDRIPHLDNLTGTEIFAEAFGCKVHRADGQMPFALPLVRTPAQADALQVPDVGNSTLAYLFEIADAVTERAGAGAAMRLVDIQSPMDIAALIWEKGELLIAMIEEPEAVKNLAQKACDLLIAFQDEWFNRYGTEYVAHYPDYYMEGGLTLSEDEVGIVNPDMFEEFFLPTLARLSEHFNGLGIHCCADSKHQWPGFAKIPQLRLLNICKNAREAFDFFDNSIVHMHHGWIPEGDPAEWPAQYPRNKRVIFDVPASSRDEAERICDALNARRSNS